MPDPRAELSSVATALDELARRVTAIAEGLSRSRDELLAVELYEVERSLIGAQRRLAKLVEAG
jgi:hypothetical protein